MDKKPAATNDSVKGAPVASTDNNETDNTAPASGDIPFLVTHWLANFVKDQKKAGIPDAERKAVIDKLSSATNEIASAFFSLGAYGSTLHPTFGASSSSFAHQSTTMQNATYSDMSRKWSGLPGSHLENLANAVVSNGTTAESAAHTSTRTNLLQAAGESTEHKEGRTVLDAINVDGDGGNVKSSSSSCWAEGSILQKPVLISTETTAKPSEEEPVRVAEAPPSQLTQVNVQSSYADVANKTSTIMRQYLEARQTAQANKAEIMSLATAIRKQEEKYKSLDSEFRQISLDPTVDPVRKLQKFDEIKSEKQGCERVATQLQRRITELSKSHAVRSSEVVRLRKEAYAWEAKRKSIVNNFRDPLEAAQNQRGSQMGSNYLLHSVLSRQHGLPRSRRRPLPARSPTHDGPNPLQIASTKKAMISSRLSVAASINTHLSYPVYCLRFDRTGRYFITGADDYLIKVFYLGAGRSCLTKNEVDGNRLLRCNYGANLRGAVLVCSLRGHAGVINDIDVSSDNCFLATASVDGDVRVWGLRNGCPVAILRGHTGGANMVSWSTLTPYRLVTTGSDGFARVWDIRDACLKRYVAMVGKRPEYKLRLTTSEKAEEKSKEHSSHAKGQASARVSESLLPPLPMRDGSTAASQAAVVSSPQAAPRPIANGLPSVASQERIIVPPLPAGVPPLPGAQGAGGGGNNAGSNNQGGQNNGNQQEIAPPGQFVANDLLDEGVKLLKKYKHGSTGEDVSGPGTRSRRAAVNVICVARCPLGGHFTTGSDDGICRVWMEQEDNRVAIVDRRHSGQGQSAKHNGAPMVTRIDNGEPLIKLMGHISAITDLAYSYAGDRILSASQKDGVIRVWSIGTSGIWNGKAQSGSVTQIVIKLTNPTASKKNTQQSSRRAPGNAPRAETSKVSCDVAVWTYDDSYVVSSQSVLVKQSGSEIQPGSQYLFLWDSHTGQCLMGFSGAHTMQCPVVIPHPDDSSLVCTAAADGFARLWDWETGRCLFTHKNKESTNQDAGNRNKLAGFLDGSWSPSGTSIVLTDDSGCVTILDSSCKSDYVGDSIEAWQKDQYFANDYYELFYDRHGYCIERGSERPPHLAPRGVRCNHAGAPWSDEVNEAFSKLIGPLPLPENICRWRRERVRSGANVTARNKGVRVVGRQTKVRRGVREFDPASTIMVKASGHVETTDKKSMRNHAIPFGTASPAARIERTSNGNNEPARSLSSNFRYLDYDDMIRRQGDPNDEELVDSDDEEFEPAARQAANANNSDESDEDLIIADADAAESPRRLGGNSNEGRRSEVTARARQQRAQRRARVRDDFVEIGSDDEMVVEFMSTNNTPSGAYVRDYESSGHYWRAPTSGWIKRKWVRRSESDSSYSGRKIYTPQLGDSVVYIPRAHFETIKEFPSLSPPWQSWPQESVWPVVRCRIRGIRYRFPYEDYFRGGGQTRCTSVVAILTLEVTGIPELSSDREFPWPKPSFVEPSRRHVFELSLFENSNCEYLFPEGLYLGRLHALEAAVRERGMQFQGLGVHLYYSEMQFGRREDVEMKEYDATISNLEEDDDLGPHLSGSGYGIIKANCESFMDTWSPWELVIDGSTSQRPSLSEEGKKFMLEHLNKILRKPNVHEYFSMPVDEVRYSDYQTMVEVEMNLMFMKRRLQSNYYGSKLGVVADLRLIRDNCIKYNTTRNDLSVVASQIVEEFETAALTSEERSILITEEEFNEFLQDPQHSTVTQQVAAVHGSHSNRPDNYSTTQTYNLRHRATSHPQSSLESLPRPRSSRLAAIRNEAANGAASGQRRTRSRDRLAGAEDVLGRMSRSETGSRTGGEEQQSILRDAGQNPPNPSSTTNETGGQEENNESTHSFNHLDDNPPAEDAPPSPARSLRISRRNVTRAAAAPRSLEDSDNDEDSDDNVRHPSRSLRRPVRNGTARRSSRNVSYSDASNDESHQNDHYSDEESDHGIDETPVSRARISARSRANTTSRGQQSVRSSPRARRRTVTQTQPESPTRRSRRAGAGTRKSYEEASDYESPAESSEGSESLESPPKKRVRKEPTYTELPSDFEEEGLSEDEAMSEEDDFDERLVPPRRQGNASRKRRNVASAPSRNKKKKPARPLGLPELAKWPDIESEHISNICRVTIEKVHQADEDGIFRIPVLESYPDIADKYLDIVDNPIDLRTIAEERMPAYKSISELQRDLITMFENCVRFNGKRAKLAKNAISLRDRINDFFQEACGEMGVLLPRRWHG